MAQIHYRPVGREFGIKTKGRGFESESVLFIKSENWRDIRSSFYVFLGEASGKPVHVL